MKRMHHIKLLAAVTIVLVTLSGFSPNRSSGGKGSSHSDGGSGDGGCSGEKSSSHSGSSDSYDSGYDDGRRDSRYDSTDGSGGSGGGSSRDTQSPTGSLAKCAAQSQPRPSATIRVRNSGSISGTYTVKVNFRDEGGALVDTGSAITTLRGDSTKRVSVDMADPTLAPRVTTCELASIR